MVNVCEVDSTQNGSKDFEPTIITAILSLVSNVLGDLITDKRREREEGARPEKPGKHLRRDTGKH